MSDQSNEHDDESDGGVGMFFWGAVIVSICIGNLYEAVHGWLCLGILLIVCAIFGRMK